MIPRRVLVLSLAFFCCALAAEPVKDPNAGIVVDPVSCEVWTTESGTKYHSKDCPAAKVKTTLAAAVVDGDTPCAKCAPPVYDPAKVAVFTSDSGAKYHLAGCRHAKNQTTLAEAVAKGLTPCATCKAPALWTPPKPAGEASAAPPAADPKKP